MTHFADVVISQLISSNLLRMTDGEVYSWKRREALIIIPKFVNKTRR
jgi:hypothetical protein